jgi:MFS transporter, SP family, solute carrier family 2 (facilitated glucose transporter), member 8
MLFLGRVLVGVGIGLISLAVPVYVSEISPTHLRGMFGATFQLFITVGILFVYGVGSAISWYWLAFVGACFPAALLFASTFLPESPRWLVTVQRLSEAERVLYRLRGADANVSDEIRELEDAAVRSQSASSGLRDLLDSSVLHPLSIGVTLMIYQQMSGINSVTYFCNSIFKDAGVSNEDAASLGVAAVQVVSTVVSVVLIDRMGRRLLLLISAFGLMTMLMLLGGFFYLKDEENNQQNWLAVMSLIVYIVFFSLATGPVPWVIMGEILPMRVRGVASSIVTLMNWTLAFVVTFTFDQLKSSLENYGAFWFYAGFCAVGFVFTFAFVPETKGRTLEEIEASFTSPGAGGKSRTTTGAKFRGGGDSL